MDQCKRETHGNLIFELTPLKIFYHDNFWTKYLGEDQTVGQGSVRTVLMAKICLPTIPKNDITYQQWVLDENCYHHCISKSCKDIELHQLFLTDYPNFQHHVKTKCLMNFSKFQHIK